ncbi:uncharacterized protein B0H18DRAFT_404418 [Fomitopsis serialis]|uniref:uncharacterized protein n=1 Tax=Fomitopsis serialis TaxID=139415 RepID=UPI0020075DE1|nr:uncharacterized protein B0H18DRAFT_404418 [Neoantrodia serialis]KAH9910868.1 hypothetical protein B0H18DRAFT_404418 [Neoantrodia serialis]
MLARLAPTMPPACRLPACLITTLLHCLPTRSYVYLHICVCTSPPALSLSHSHGVEEGADVIEQCSHTLRGL